MKLKHALTFLLISGCCAALCGQARQLELPLDDAIAMARVQSVDAAVALDELRTAYWQWRTFRADQLPEITFTATLPEYGKQYNSYLNSDGEYSFVPTNSL